MPKTSEIVFFSLIRAANTAVLLDSGLSLSFEEPGLFVQQGLTPQPVAPTRIADDTKTIIS